MNSKEKSAAKGPMQASQKYLYGPTGHAAVQKICSRAWRRGNFAGGGREGRFLFYYDYHYYKNNHNCLFCFVIISMLRYFCLFDYYVLFLVCIDFKGKSGRGRHPLGGISSLV